MRKLILLLSVAFLLTGCGVGAAGMDDMPMSENGLIDVALSWNSQSIHPNEMVTFQAFVTQSGKNVDDADQVVFEIWKEGAPADQHEKASVNVASSDNGRYKLEKSFLEVGKYHVIAHVTARGNHNMPEKTFEVSAN